MSDEFWTMFNTQHQLPKSLQESALVQDSDHMLTNDDQVKDLGKREKEIIYRGKIGALFKDLNSLIPLYRKCNNSRLSVLEKSIIYIQKLKSEFKLLKEENCKLRQENERLVQIIKVQGVYSNVTLPSPSLL